MGELCFKCGWLHQDSKYGRRCFADSVRAFRLPDDTIVWRPMCRQCGDSWHLRAQDPQLGVLLSHREADDLQRESNR